MNFCGGPGICPNCTKATGRNPGFRFIRFWVYTLLFHRFGGEIILEGEDMEEAGQIAHHVSSKCIRRGLMGHH